MQTNTSIYADVQPFEVVFEQVSVYDYFEPVLYLFYTIKEGYKRTFGKSNSFFYDLPALVELPRELSNENIGG